MKFRENTRNFELCDIARIGSLVFLRKIENHTLVFEKIFANTKVSRKSETNFTQRKYFYMTRLFYTLLKIFACIVTTLRKSQHFLLPAKVYRNFNYFRELFLRKPTLIL